MRHWGVKSTGFKSEKCFSEINTFVSINMNQKKCKGIQFSSCMLDNPSDNDPHCVSLVYFISLQSVICTRNIIAPVLQSVITSASRVSICSTFIPETTPRIIPEF